MLEIVLIIAVAYLFYRYKDIKKLLAQANEDKRRIYEERDAAKRRTGNNHDDAGEYTDYEELKD